MALAIICVQTSPDLGLMCLLAAGGLLGFLCFNRYPALVFMGDTGSLAIGGLMATVCIFAHCEVVLLLTGIIYVVETLSVILQVASFKLTGKRIFRMSPLHHHYELGGMPEPLIVLQFSLVQAIAAGIAVLLWVYHLAN
jgi:phospho-N-acetylmuramoyl-pentapeptide-transferase